MSFTCCFDEIKKRQHFFLQYFEIFTAFLMVQVKSVGLSLFRAQRDQDLPCLNVDLILCHTGINMSDIIRDHSINKLSISMAYPVLLTKMSSSGVKHPHNSNSHNHNGPVILRTNRPS